MVIFSTNAHVVDAADEVTVRLTDKREFKAKVIGSDRRTDVALVKIDASGLPKVTIGKPDLLKVGEWVFAIGSPFGFDNSVTAGIVSAKGRSLPQENYVPFIQTDVAINPGNSGGPLFNMRGEVVGINSQIYSRSGGFMGLSFAIPIDVAIDISDQLRTQGKINRGWLGVMIQEMTKELAESFGLSKPMGALIANVDKGSPADKAGHGGKRRDSQVRRQSGGKLQRTAAPGGFGQAGQAGDGPALAQGRIQGCLGGGGRTAGQGTGRAPKVSKTSNKLGLTLNELSEDQKRELKISSRAAGGRCGRRCGTRGCWPWRCYPVGQQPGCKKPGAIQRTGKPVRFGAGDCTAHSARRSFPLCSDPYQRKIAAWAGFRPCRQVSGKWPACAGLCCRTLQPQAPRNPARKDGGNC